MIVFANVSCGYFLRLTFFNILGFIIIFEFKYLVKRVQKLL